MRLLVDAQAVTSSSSLRGIGRYALSLTRALVDAAGDHQVEVLIGSGADPDRSLQARLALEQVVGRRAVHVFDAAWPWQERSAGAREAAEAAYAAAVASIGPGALLILSTFERDDETVLAVETGPSTTPTAAVLYDLMPAMDPRTYLMGPEAEAYWRRYHRLAACDALLAISDHSAEQARTLLADLCPPVTTVWGGPYVGGALPEPAGTVHQQPTFALPERIVLSVGGDHPRKNLDNLVAAWGRVPPHVRRGRALVLACGLNPGTVRRLQLLARRSGLRAGEFVLTGRVSDTTLDRLYRHAELFVFPSLEEGLGMPALEAMGRGCPTLLARGSSLSELADDDAAFFDPRVPADMATAITRVLSEPRALAELVRTAARTAERFTWKATAELAWRALEELPSPEPRSPSATPSPVRSSDGSALQGLAASPAVVLLDSKLPEGDRGALGLPVATRAGLAPATALMAGSAQDAGWAVRAGVLDQPVLRGPGDLAQLAAHDFLAEYAARLAPLDLDAQAAERVVAAARRAPRWTLERLRPAWLLLSPTTVDEGVAERAAERGVDLVVATMAAAGLAGQVDVVLVAAGHLGGAETALSAARCRGSLVVALHVQQQELDTPWWCTDAVLDGPLESAASWTSYLGRAAPGQRTTGWPWRTSDG